jgi:hypothetical protein
METVRFPACVGDEPDRTMAIIRMRMGRTRVRFQIVWHDRPQSMKASSVQLSDANVVVLHVDTKWNAVCRIPVFQGKAFKEDSASELSEAVEDDEYWLHD